MSWTEVRDFQHPTGWLDSAQADEGAARACRQLESGEILFFPQPPFELPEADRAFLIDRRYEDSRLHKNISYRPEQDLLRGFGGQPPETTRMHDVMRRYSGQVTQFLTQFLAPYAAHWTIDFASFRPLEEEGRDLPLHKRNDLLHVDAFPSRPTHGGRILRIFTNINPAEARIWVTSDSFDSFAPRLAADAGLDRIAAGAGSPLRSLRKAGASLARSVGVRVPDRSPYDEFMLRFHDYLKENAEFQRDCPKNRSGFPPLATWLVFTDGVPHAALSGRYALEQTYIIPPTALLAPEKAPIRVLESLSKRKLSG